MIILLGPLAHAGCADDAALHEVDRNTRFPEFLEGRGIGKHFHPIRGERGDGSRRTRLVKAELLGGVIHRRVGMFTRQLLGNAAAPFERDVFHVEAIGRVQKAGQQLVLLALTGTGHDPITALFLGGFYELVDIGNTGILVHP